MTSGRKSATLPKITHLSSGSNNALNQPSIERSVANPSVAIGYFYNARNDSIVETFDEHNQSKKEKVNQQLSAVMYKGENTKIGNLFQSLQIDDDTSLSLILNIIKPNGILSIINYAYLIDDLTRFIYYSESIEEELLNSEFRKDKHLSNSSTHLITKIKYGISFVAILQLSLSGSSSINKIDKTLQDVTSRLGSEYRIEDLIQNEKMLHENILRTKVYSNIDDLSRLNNINDLYRQVQLIRQDSSKYRPLNFTLTPICDSHANKHIFIGIKHEDTKNVIESLLPVSFDIKILKRTLKDLKKSLPKDSVDQILDQTQQLLTELNISYNDYVETIKKSVIQIRSRENLQVPLDQLLNNQEKELLIEKRNSLINYVDNLKSKVTLVVDLEKEKIAYLNVVTIDIDGDDDQQTVEKKLFQNDQYVKIFCGNDQLKRANQQRWDELMEELIESRTNKKEFKLIYADFSYSSYQLNELKILDPKKETKKKKKKKVLGSSRDDSMNGETRTNGSTITIVLFGESGVGKSTFINAVANYLLFPSVEEARQSDPVVIIPVSFVMTVSDNFEERIIKFGQFDSNENHNNLGESVTQSCKSYEFRIPNGKILKIIDTPGFGDTRGIEQDEKNLKEIFSYLDNLKNLNGLCLLLKPNVKELNPSFKTSFRSIVQYLGKNSFKNIYFCFTNSQSTFFTVGDTTPVLNQFLKTFQKGEITLKKENTFCFDSEAFRYLIASQQSIQFEQHFIEQFQQSWSKSVKESYRFIEQISSQQRLLRIDQAWITIEQIITKMNYLIRPILETIRNLLRNVILSQKESSQKSIKLVPISLPSPQFICYKFDRSYKTYGEFHILSDSIHDPSDQCDNEHLTTNFKLNYQLIEGQTEYSDEDENQYLYGIIKASANFDYFLNENDRSKKDNRPFLSGINRMINEEEYICEREQSHDLNKKLRNRLEKSKDQYFREFENINVTNEHRYIKSIYSRIEGIKEMPMIYQQLYPDQ